MQHGGGTKDSRIMSGFFGSDWYVSTADPLPQIETAVTGEDAFDRFPGAFIPEERISLHDAIAAFTINAV